MVVIHRPANRNHNIPRLQEKKTIAREHTITADHPAVSPFHLYHHTNISPKTATHLIHAHTSKIRTDLHRARIEMIVAIKNMVEVADNRWRSVNPLRGNVPPLLADIVEDAR